MFSEEQLDKLCSDALERARNYGLRSKQDLCKYASLVLRYGLDFENTDEHQWQRDILVDKDVPSASERLTRLLTAIEHKQMREQITLQNWEAFRSE